MNIYWYGDDELEIIFDKIPDVGIRMIKPLMSDCEIKSVNEKPFVNKKELNVIVKDKIELNSYNFCIPDGYVWDGATIPRILWHLIGSKTEPRFLIPSLIHDFLCENHACIDNDRYLSTVIFERLLFVSKVNPFNRWLIKHCVDNYQKFCGW